MSQIVLQSLKKFTNNDIYFMEVVEEKIIINDNYDGVLILDSDLNILKSIRLLEELSIDTSFLNNQQIVLYCYENQCLIYINIDTYEYKIISLSADFEDKVFLSLYEWVDIDLFLIADDGDFFAYVNLNSGEVQSAERDIIDKLSFSIKNDWKKLSQFLVHKIYVQRAEAVIEKNNVIKLINYKKQEEAILDIEPFEMEPLFFYDVEVMGMCIAQISEKEILLYCTNKKSTLLPNYPQYSFVRGKFISANDEIFILLLSSSNSESSEAVIEKYYIGDKSLREKDRTYVSNR